MKWVKGITSKLDDEIQMNLTNLTSSDSYYAIKFDVRADSNTMNYYIVNRRIEFKNGKIILDNDEEKHFNVHQNCISVNFCKIPIPQISKFFLTHLKI